MIPVYRRDEVVAHANVDPSDHAVIAAHKWVLHPQGYASRHVGRGTVLMHRQVLGLAAGDGEVDHINRDRLDNRRENLRVGSHADNMQNYPSFGATSRFRGVCWLRGRERWQVTAKVRGRRVFLGYFTDELEAAKVAEAFRAEHLPFAQPDPNLVMALATTEGAA